MSNLSWTSSASGDWTNAADWSGGVVPGAADDVTIAVAGITVTVSTGAQAADSITTTKSAFALTGGQLAIGSYANLHGTYAQSGGSLTVGGQGLDFFSTATISAGSIDVQSGTFTAGGTFSQSGGFISLTGTSANFSGPVLLTGGSLDDGAGSFSETGSLAVNGGTLLLDTQSAMLSGALALQSGAITQQAGTFTDSAAVAVSGGTLTVGGQSSAFSGSIALTGGEILLQTGSLTAAQAVGVSGGTLALGGQSAIFNAALTLSSGQISLAGAELVTNGSYSQTGGTMTLDGNADFAGAVTLGGGLIDETGGSFLSTGSFSQTGGTLDLTGLASFKGPTNFTGGTINVSDGEFISSGSYTQNSGTLLLSGPYSDLMGGTTLAGGEIDSQSGTLFSSNGFAQTGGLLVLSGSGGLFNNNLQQTGGTIRMQSGALSLYGADNTLNGTISGAGTLLVADNTTGLNGTTTIGSGTVLSVAKLSVTSGALALAQTAKPYDFSYGGYFSATQTGTVQVNGNTLTLAGRAQLGADFTGGTVVADGGGQLNGLILDNSALLDIGSAVILTAQNDNPGLVTLRSDSQVVIGSAGTLMLTGNDLIADASNNATLTDDGLLNRLSGDGTAEVQTSFIEGAQGSLSIGLGTLDFSGASDSFSGTISGAGTLSLNAQNTSNTTTYSFGSNIKLDTAGFLLSGGQLRFDFTGSYTYSGLWIQRSGVFLLGNQGQTLTLDLTGGVVLDGGVFKSSTGTLNTTGLVSVGNSDGVPPPFDLEGFTIFEVHDELDQAATMELGAQSGSLPVAIIEAGASWLMEDASSITGTFGELINNGTLEKYNGSGVSSIDGTLVNNALLTIASSTLQLDGNGTLGGTITGSGLLALDGDYTLEKGLSLTVAQVLVDTNPLGQPASVVSLGANLSYAGVWAQHGGAVQLDGQTLTLKGTTALDGGVVAGPGILSTSGSLTLGGTPGSIFTVNGQAELLVTKSAEQVSTIDIDGGASLVIAKGATFTQDDPADITGAGTLSVQAGATATFSGEGFGQISPSVVDAGSIVLSRGELSFLNAVTGKGALTVHTGAELDLMNFVSSTNTINLSAGGASLLIGDAPAFNGLISGFASGDFIELSALASGFIGESLSSNDKTLTLTDSASHTFALHFAQAQSLSSFVISTGPHGYIGIYHI